MFKFLKRAFAPPKPAPLPPRSGERDNSVETSPAPLPEVTEGNGEADWSLWHDSVNQLDSQFRPVPEFRNTEPASPDTFGNASKSDR